MAHAADHDGMGVMLDQMLDFAVERLFPIAETHTLHFRTEFFNLTNTPQFANPSTTLGFSDPTQLNPVASPSFGRITGTVDVEEILDSVFREFCIGK